ncbi:MAG: dTDP-glucose 4,6-dehydratase [Pelagibacteraceae bacterium]|jgi:dTDP-glucose 4,6-dehydratase|nr:dTDP-glucose 4,6-dehydratase [Pelagibacteraceae bacterium]|tara:strand:- start:195 stop:1199 length:1005 start_codon:yes stop_codon:yes gene_type:complete
MKKNKKTFLVIGSNSFSGSAFIYHLLKRKYNVIGVSRSKELLPIFLRYKNLKNEQRLFKFFQIDLNKNCKKLINLIKKYKPSYIINLAAQSMVAESWDHPEHWYQTNVFAQIQLCEEINKLNFIKKYVHVTTPEVYGSSKNKIKENFNFNPSTPYAVSRACCDLHLRNMWKLYNFPVVFTRAANVYGPCQQLYRIIPRALLYARKNKQLMLHGGGKSIRSFIHIDDVAEATISIALEAKIGKTYHISTNNFISIKELTKKISFLTNKNFSDFVNVASERSGKDHAYLLDSSSLRKELNWRDKVSLDFGLKQTLEWVDSNLSKLSKSNQFYVHKK